MEKDNTKYLFNEKKLGKGKLVLAVIRQYIADHNPSYEQLKLVFPDSLQGSSGTIINENGYHQKLSKSQDTANRYYINEKLLLNDGDSIYVSNQWVIGNIDRFISKAKELGYDIKFERKNNSNKLLDLFYVYKTSPGKGVEWVPQWISFFRNRCNEFKEIINKNVNDIDNQFIETFWLVGNNHISSVKPGFLSTEEYNSIKNELPKISLEIANDPSPKKLDEILKWAEDLRNQGKLKTIKQAVIHRVFVAAAPELYSTILKKDGIKKFITELNFNFNMKLSTSGNWAEMNGRAMKAIRDQGLHGEDDFIVNTFAWALYDKLVLGKGDILNEHDIDVIKQTKKQGKRIQVFNQIFYGPPGTGKTYNTINRALQIIDPEFDKKNNNKENRSKLKSKFDEYVNNGRIGFVTFHQSFSYEDFVEGLRAEADDDGSICYFVQDGIFKMLCEKAKQNVTGIGIDEAIQQLIEKMEEEPLHLQTSSGKGFTVTYRGGRTFRVKPDSSDKLADYPASIENIKKVFRGVSLKEVYNPSYVLSLLEHLKSVYGLSDETISDAQSEPVVLIIDEINRGNTANIFGELITLIEPSKRAGAEEALSVVLPYSKERFSVPDNLFIIGTMNTADRSLALIDTALRRRFQFEEMLPQANLLSEITIDGINIQQLLTIMNKRIALLYDREHTLGHSFFLSLNENSTIQHLREIFEGQILPLLEEYFFEDWEKIRQVLGDPLKPKDLQIIKPDIDEEEIALLLGDGNNNMLNSLYYRDHTALSNPQAYIAIYEKD